MDDRPGTEKAEGSKDCHAPLIPFRPLFTDSTHLHSFTNGITQPLLFIIPRILYIYIYIYVRAALDRHPNRGKGKVARAVRVGARFEGGRAGTTFPANFKSHLSSKFSNLENFDFFRFLLFEIPFTFQYFYSI